MWSSRTRRERLGLGPRRPRRYVGHETSKEPHYVTVEVLPGEAESPEKSAFDIPIIERSSFFLDGFKDRIPRKRREVVRPVAKSGEGSGCTEETILPHDVNAEGDDNEISNSGGIYDEDIDFSGSSEAVGGLAAALFCPVTVQWLLENYETKVGVSLPRSTVYNHYIRHCKSHSMEPVNAASFGKLIRSIFLGLQTRRLGTRGNSKYHYYGIQIKPESILNGVHERDSGSQSETDGEEMMEREPKDCKEVPLLDVTGGEQGESSKDAESAVVEDNDLDLEELAHHLYVNCRIEPQSYLKFALNCPTYRDVKDLKEWQKDIRIITKFTCDPQRKDLQRKIQQECAKFEQYIPKVDHKLSSESFTRNEVEIFRASYTSFCELLIKSTVLYKLDTVIHNCHKYWQGLPLLKRTLSFSTIKLKTISGTENLRLFIQSVDAQVYEVMVNILFPDVLNPIPVVVLDVVRNFALKFVNSVPITMKEYSEELKKIKSLAAEGFSHVILNNCKLNMLADAVRPLFEESHRMKAYRRLKELNVPAALSVSIYPIANEDKYFYLVETYRQALAKMTNLDSYCEWVAGEVNKALGSFKSLRDESRFEEQAKIFAEDMSYILYVICSQMAFMDTEVNTFFALLQMFTNNYVLYLIEEKRSSLESMSRVQYVIHSLTLAREYE